jgi:hypothetical protein
MGTHKREGIGKNGEPDHIKGKPYMGAFRRREGSRAFVGMGVLSWESRDSCRQCCSTGSLSAVLKIPQTLCPIAPRPFLLGQVIDPR